MKVAFTIGPKGPPANQTVDRVVEVELPRRLHWSKVYEWGCKVAKRVYGDVHVEAVSHLIHPLHVEAHGDKLEGAGVVIHVSPARLEPLDKFYVDFLKEIADRKSGS